MGNDERKITKTTAVLMVCVALFIDFIQFLLNFIPVVGWVIIWMINILAFPTFYLWFKLKGVSFSSPWRALSFWGAFLVETIPIINALPTWTLAVVITISSSWKEELAAKVGIPPAIAGRIGKGSGKN